jgi:small subunit ribosomal protein S8
MMSDPIADLLTRIRNAYAARLKVVLVPHSKLKEAIVKIMAKHEFIADYKVTGKKPKTSLEIGLKYDRRKPALRAISRVSKPGVRIYAGSPDLTRLMRGLGIVLLSTPKGVMTASEAKKQNIGGEVICRMQ